MSIESHALPTPPSEPSSCRCQSSIADDSPRILAIGELDIAGVPLLDAEITALRAAGFRHLILDLSALEFIDSTGLRSSLNCDAEARRDGLTIALIPGPPAVERIFELTHTRARLPFIDP